MLSLRQKIGQMLIIGFDGLTIDAHHPVKDWLVEGVGGVILFDSDVRNNGNLKNIAHIAQVKTLISNLKDYSLQFNTQREQYPLLVAVDYEGGAVDRFKKMEGAPINYSAAELAHLPVEERQQILAKMASMLQELGFNLNFAPVVDLNLNPEQGIIGRLDRCFDKDADIVSSLAEEFVDVFNQYQIHCCYKHFPGHGSAAGDTHQSAVDITETFSPDELRPYRRLMRTKQPLAMVMTAHVINRQLDPSGLPATLSSPILNLLREEMNFQGVIVSDDLQMNAISKQYSLAESLALSINAGADMLIFANQLGFIEPNTVINEIERLIQQGHIAEEKILQAAQRIFHLKNRFIISKQKMNNDEMSLS